MTVKRFLIVNADDFGQSPGVNRGIIKAYEDGIVTSASLMVRWTASVKAARYAIEHPDLSLGLHLDFGEWAYRDETWMPLYEVVPLDDEVTMRDEVSRQIDAFRRLVGTDPTHIDSHQHIHLKEPLRAIAKEVARSLGVPLRHCNEQVRYCRDFYGQTERGWPYPQGISIDKLSGILTSLPLGITELGCHPSDGIDLDTMYASERIEEVKVLCDPRIRAAIMSEGIKLRSFDNLRIF